MAFTKYRGIARARRLPEKENDYQYRGIARARRQNQPIYVTPALLNLLRPAIHLYWSTRAYIVACIAPDTVFTFSPGQSRDTPQKVGGGAVAVDYNKTQWHKRIISTKLGD